MKRDMARAQRRGIGSGRAGRGPRRALRTAALALILLVPGCAQRGATVQGQKVHNLYVVIALMAAPVFIAVEGLLIWSLVRFRKRANGPALGPQTAGSTRALVAFFVIPAVIVAALFGFGEQTLASITKQEPDAPIRIRAEGFQWEWTFYYLNEGFFVSGKTKTAEKPETPAVMKLPVGESATIELHSRDVIHSLFIPGFLFKKDVIPGRTNAFTVAPRTLGTFKSQCAEFCGLWHSHMTFVVEVVTPEDYSSWAEEQIKAIQSITCKPKGPAPSIVAKDISWNTNCLALPPGPPGPPPAITVANKDAGIDHNFAIYDSFSQTKRFFQTGRFPGVSTRSFPLPPLPPGRYYFQCDVHGPSMSGVFIVGGGK